MPIESKVCNQEGVRLDAFVTESFDSSYSRSFYKRLIDDGEALYRASHCFHFCAGILQGSDRRNHARLLLKGVFFQSLSWGMLTPLSSEGTITAMKLNLSAIDLKGTLKRVHHYSNRNRVHTIDPYHLLFRCLLYQ